MRALAGDAESRSIAIAELRARAEGAKREARIAAQEKTKETDAKFKVELDDLRDKLHIDTGKKEL